MPSDWTSMLNRMGYVKRKLASRKKLANVAEYEQLKGDFSLEIRIIVNMNKIPPELVINFHQAVLNYISIS